MPQTQPPLPRPRPVTKNRLAAILCHIPRYSGRYLSRFSEDTGIGTSTLRRILKGETDPTYLSILRIERALTKVLDRSFDVAEFIVPLGEPFATRCPCDLFSCTCYPPWAYDQFERLKPEFIGVKPGSWTFEVSPGHLSNP